ASIDGTADVEGTAIVLEGGPALAPTPTPSNLTIVRLVADDPRTGGSRLAVDGRRPPGVATSNVIEVSVWAPRALRVDKILGIVAGGITSPAVVVAGAAPQTIRVVLGLPTPFAPGATPIDVHPVAAAGTTFVADFDQHDREVVIRDLGVGALPSAGLVVGVRFRETGISA